MFAIKLLKAKTDFLTVKLRLLFIKNKQLRNRYKKFNLYKISKTLSSKLKWGISYSVFDGEELLEKSLKSVRNSADYINVVYQTTSWYNESCSKDLIRVLKKCKEQNLIDEIIEYKPNYEKSAGKQELEKRNIGLKYSKKAGCDYFMPMDTDEFYLGNELEKLKRKISINGITNAYCMQKLYLTPTKRIQEFPRHAVTLFGKINVFSKMKANKNNIILIDPTRQISGFFNKKPYVFLDIYMHHYSFFRKDINKKIRNSSGKVMLPKTSETIKVHDYFKLGEIFEE